MQRYKNIKKNKILNSSKILALLRKNHEILRRYKVKRIGLFGSFARNEQNNKSDIDFLVEFKKPIFDNLIELHEQLRKIYGRKVEIITKQGISRYIKPYIEKEVKWYEVK